MYIVTCDIGKEGGLVLGEYKDNKVNIISYKSMPNDIKDKFNLLNEWKSKYGIDVIVVEEQGGRGGNSATANFTIGLNTGIIKCLIEMLDIREVIYVNPHTWQTILKSISIPPLSNTSLDGFKDSKKKSILMATSKFPSLTLARKSSRSVKYLDGVTDSLCILIWYLSKYHNLNL